MRWLLSGGTPRVFDGRGNESRTTPFAKPQGRAAPTWATPRRGAAMVYVLVLLLLISLVGVTLVRAAVALHRQRLRDELHAQTVRLAEAGWNRAVRKLTADPKYSGETWSIPADALPPERAAEVRIEVAAENGVSTLQVTAEYPLDDPEVTRYTLDSSKFPTPGR